MKSAKVRERRSAEDRRSEILEAAKKRFAVAGFEGTSTRQIADDLGVAQSLLLYHFANKNDVWQAVMTQIFDHVRAIARDELAKVKSNAPGEQLRAGIRAFIRICQEEPDLHRLMTTEGRSKTPRLEWLVDNFLSDGYGATVTLIRDCQKRGEVRSGDPTLLYYTIIAIAGSAFSYAPEMALLNPMSAPVDPKAVEKLIVASLFLES